MIYIDLFWWKPSRIKFGKHIDLCATIMEILKVLEVGYTSLNYLLQKIINLENTKGIALEYCLVQRRFYIEIFDPEQVLVDGLEGFNWLECK